MTNSNSHPFPDAESAWFWCVQTTEARHEGARQRAGHGDTPRPCEAVDIQKVVLRLIDKKLLQEPHVRTLGRYGRAQLRPSGKIRRDVLLWTQAMQRLTPPLQQKGIVR
jgi:hypothetical protein